MIILHHQNAGTLKGQHDTRACVDWEHVTVGQYVSGTTSYIIAEVFFFLWILMIFSYYEILAKSLDIEQIDSKTY